MLINHNHNRSIVDSASKLLSSFVQGLQMSSPRNRHAAAILLLVCSIMSSKEALAVQGLSWTDFNRTEYQCRTFCEPVHGCANPPCGWVCPPPVCGQWRIPLPDGDLINVTFQPNAVSSDIIEFELQSAPDITWWKGLRVYDGVGSDWQIENQDGQAWSPYDSQHGIISLWAHQASTGHLVFSKAKFFGWHTDMYVLYDLATQMLPGTRVIFRWVQD